MWKSALRIAYVCLFLCCGAVLLMVIQPGTKADINEKDTQYLATCRETGRAAAKFYGWNVIQCVKDGCMRSIEDIHGEIYGLVKACLEG